MEAIAKYLHQNPDKSFTLAQLAEKLCITKDRARHQASRAIKLGQIEPNGTTTESSSTPAQLFRAKVHKPDPKAASFSSTSEIFVDEDESEATVNPKAIEFITLQLCGQSLVPANVKKSQLERDKKKQAMGAHFF